MKESGTCFKISAMRPHSSADFCTFIRLNALCTSPFSHAIYVNCVGSKSPPGSQIHLVPAVAKLFGAMLLVFAEGVFPEGVSRMFCMVKLYSHASHLFLAQGLVGVVLLGTFQACPRLPSSEFLFVPKVNQEG